jgi:hypothetical protein
MNEVETYAGDVKVKLRPIVPPEFSRRKGEE